ncbi:hypothetical protein BDN72DRAFT_106028 [Pluteus cervinus]|uniref:Uncharacterized protein n=1 Tax=Pluteus cervinus TaxID=181527 RepID=A0ACD3APV9_9AGAR|nr:hypothetical protein BDN72DRAFT_106028 [Pluteus cervinus]
MILLHFKRKPSRKSDQDIKASPLFIHISLCRIGCLSRWGYPTHSTSLPWLYSSLFIGYALAHLRRSLFRIPFLQLTGPEQKRDHLVQIVSFGVVSDLGTQVEVGALDGEGY